MKKLLLFFAITTFISCSRTDAETSGFPEPIKNEYFVKYKVNGTLLEKKFTKSSLFAEKVEQYTLKSDPTIRGSIIVLTSDWEVENALRFSDYDSNPAKSKYYFDYKTFTTTPGMTNFVFKYVDNGTKYTYGGYVNNSNDDSTFSLNISSVNNNIATGTFSGKINAWTGPYGDSGTKKVFIIAEGDFRIPIIDTTW